MLVLTSAETIRHLATHHPQNAPESRLLHYAELLDTEPIAWLFVVQPGDTLALLAALRGGRLFEDPEFIALEDGWYEAVFVLSDDGFGHVVLVPDQPDTDAEILKLCRSL